MLHIPLGTPARWSLTAWALVSACQPTSNLDSGAGQQDQAGDGLYERGDGAPAAGDTAGLMPCEILDPRQCETRQDCVLEPVHCEPSLNLPCDMICLPGFGEPACDIYPERCVPPPCDPATGQCWNDPTECLDPARCAPPPMAPPPCEHLAAVECGERADCVPQLATTGETVDCLPLWVVPCEQLTAVQCWERSDCVAGDTGCVAWQIAGCEELTEPRLCDALPGCVAHFGQSCDGCPDWVFLGCFDRDPCVGLGLVACNLAPTCTAHFVPSCSDCAPNRYAGCASTP